MGFADCQKNAVRVCVCVIPVAGYLKQVSAVTFLVIFSLTSVRDVSFRLRVFIRRMLGISMWSRPARGFPAR